MLPSTDATYLPVGRMQYVLPFISTGFPEVRIEVIRFLSNLLRNGMPLLTIANIAIIIIISLYLDVNRKEFVAARGMSRVVMALSSDVTNKDLQLHSLAVMNHLVTEGAQSIPANGRYLTLMVGIGRIVEELGRAGIIEIMAEETLGANNEQIQSYSLQLCAALSAHKDFKDR